MLRKCLRIQLVLAAVAAALAVASTGAAGAAPRAHQAALPTAVYAPFFETWTRDSLSDIARRSGATDFTLAFVEGTTKHSCSPAWNGDPRRLVTNGRYVHDIARLRRMGGDVVPSFGGYSADHQGREIADSCTTMADLVAAYKSVVTTLGVTRLDMDVEDRSLGNTAGIDRRNEALARVERWAKAHGRTLQVEYTLPTTPDGLEPDGLAVLQSAVAHHTRVDVVNIMTFDYYDSTTTDMGGAAISAARGLFHQLHALYPNRTPRQLWRMEGNTILPGIDDYPKKTEVTTLHDARRLQRFATRTGLGVLSIWAIQRDNGGCPGEIDANECSGIQQPRWAFSHILGARG
jgi:hypothetical protein